MTFRRLAHWMFNHPPHRHHYAYHAERDDMGTVRFFWRCMFILCGEEIEDTDDD